MGQPMRSKFPALSLGWWAYPRRRRAEMLVHPFACCAGNHAML